MLFTANSGFLISVKYNWKKVHLLWYLPRLLETSCLSSSYIGGSSSSIYEHFLVFTDSLILESRTFMNYVVCCLFLVKSAANWIICSFHIMPGEYRFFLKGVHNTDYWRIVMMNYQVIIWIFFFEQNLVISSAPLNSIVDSVAGLLFCNQWNIPA